MNIKLEIEKYNYYRLLGESYEPKSIAFALSKNNKYIIIENVLFDLEKNQRLGVYYKNSLINEQENGDVEKNDEWPWETWDMEDWLDLTIAGATTIADISGVGTGVAKAVDIAHGLSFIYRGITRKNNTYTIVGVLSIVLASVPNIGSGIKGVIVGLSKTTLGRSTKGLIQYLSKNKLFMNTIPPLMNKIMGALKGIKSFIDDMASKYTWVDDVWSKVKSSWDGIVKWFEEFMSNFKSNLKRGADRSKLPKSTVVASRVASNVDFYGAKAGDYLIKLTRNKFFNATGLNPIKNLEKLTNWVGNISKTWGQQGGVKKAAEKMVTKYADDIEKLKKSKTALETSKKQMTNSTVLRGSTKAGSEALKKQEIGVITKKIEDVVTKIGETTKLKDAQKSIIKNIDELYKDKGWISKAGVTVQNLGYIIIYWQYITAALLYYNQAFCVHGVKQDDYKEDVFADDETGNSSTKYKSDTGYGIYDNVAEFIMNFDPDITKIPEIGRMIKLSTFTIRCDELDENENAFKQSMDLIMKTITDGKWVSDDKIQYAKDAVENIEGNTTELKSEPTN